MKKKSILVLVWLVLLVSLGINGYQYYKKRETDKSAMGRLSIRNFKDSVNKVIADLELSLEHMALLQNDNKEMVAAIAKLEARSPKTIIRTNTIDPNKETLGLMKQIKSLQKQLREASKPVNELMANSGNQPLSSSDLEAIDTYKTLVESKQKEIVALTSEVEELQVSREKYASDHSTEIQGQYDNLRLENNELKDRFEKGAVPQLSNFMVKGGATEDGIFNTSVKSKKIKRLRFSFDILENPLIIKPIKEEIIIRVISESGAVLSTTELNGKMMSSDEVYTLKDEIQIEAKMQGSAPQVLWFPEDEELQDRLSKGTYIIQLISRDKIKQIVEFSVN